MKVDCWQSLCPAFSLQIKLKLTVIISFLLQLSLLYFSVIMIQDLRKYTDSFLFKLLLGFISVTFVISFGMGSFFGDRKEVIARVDETEILQRDFQRMYGQQLESLRQRLGENADQIAQQVNLRQQVFQQLIDRQLLLNMAESLNLRATDLEVQEYIRQQPYFQKNGQFDFETYETLLSQNRLPTEDYEESVRLDLLFQKKPELLLIQTEEYNLQKKL